MKHSTQDIKYSPFFSHTWSQEASGNSSCLELPHPHNTENIKDTVDEVLQEWNIPITKLNIVITDNGSKMLKAFKQIAYVDSEDVEFDENESDLSDTPMEEEEL